MRNPIKFTKWWLVLCLGFPGALLSASQELMQTHCSDCHNETKAKGKFKLTDLGAKPDEDSLDRWLDCLDLVTAEEMPPEDDSHLSTPERTKIVAYLDKQIRSFEAGSEITHKTKPRRLNNREFSNSVRDVLLLEHVGTNHPMNNLIGDSLHHGFDTHGETLGFSRFHLEQYIEAARKVVNGTILSGEQPESKVYQISPKEMYEERLRQNVTREGRTGKDGYYDIRSPLAAVILKDFKTVRETGHYRIKVRATGIDRGVYDTKETGFYDDDPIQLSVHMGSEIKTYDLPDNDVLEIELQEWMVKDSIFKLKNPTDAFTLRGNGNFKFQNGITPDYLKVHDPDRYAALVEKINASPKKNRRRNIDTWHNWVEQWMGARPRIFGVEIEGPFFASWPPQHQVKLLGENPKVENAAEILKPFAARAWRRPVRDGELDKIVAMVEGKAESLGDIEALKEGIVAILVSPAFLMLNSDNLAPLDQFASKFSYFLSSTMPAQELRDKVGAGELSSFDSVEREIQSLFNSDKAEAFLREFPFAWLELNDINFMSPDPQHYRFYHKKRVSEDMIAEALRFFRHVVEENLPVTEFISADYSFINADLATIYGIDGVPQDSILRKHTFADGRRGGFLGMGAFLTATADSLATSPIHRAIYVMENFMGIHPTPPPPDVEIKEPDVRQAKTIKEILAAHTSDETCAGCHKSIDPWGYAFENFDPTGAWRDAYVVPAVLTASEDGDPQKGKKGKKEKDTTIPIDSSAKFRNGIEYQNIVDFRSQILTDANRDRFVRCFITKLLTYANGAEPAESDFVEIDSILSKSAEHDYRIVETIAAVVDSPLFRN